MDDFDAFWKQYPRHIGKLSAQRAYVKARTQASAAEILDGVGRYVTGKPGYADYCYPATWLNAGRWMDEYDTAASGKPTRDWCEHQPRCHNQSWHQVVVARERGEV